MSHKLLLRGAVYNRLHRLGYDSVKPEQFDTVESLLNGEGLNVFLSVHTGFGKSLVYQLLPVIASLCSKPPPYLYIWVQVSICGSEHSDQIAERS